MGNAQVPRYEDPKLLLTEYQDLVGEDILASYKLFKVMRCRREREGYVVAKIFIHRDGAPDLKVFARRVLEVKDAFRSHWLHPNVVPYQGVEIGSQSAVLLRPHFARNLYDRMHMRPFLSECAKNWIAFQVLCAVSQAHSVGIAHGDLKTENVFVSSWNHAVLSDFALFKPLVLPTNDTSEFSFFFESNLVRRRCYLAPERFDSPAASSGLGRRRGDGVARFSEELAAMDVFSLGCVLAELFLDGQTLMDLPALLKYRSAQLDLTAKLAGIKNKAVQEILGSMLEREPGRRRSASSYLREWCTRVAPRAFRSCVFPLAVILLHPIYQHPDMRIALLRHNFAGLLWSTVGPASLGAMLDVPDAGANLADVWASWLQHIERRVRSVDCASLHSMVHAAAQSALQRAEQLGQGAEADRASLSDSPDGGRPPAFALGLAPPLSQPWLREDACRSFTASLMDHWAAGCQRCVDAGEAEAEQAHAVHEGLASGIYGRFLHALCSRGDPTAAPEPPGSGAPPLPVGDAGTVGHEVGRPDKEVLEIFCGIICSSVQHTRNPRMRMICLDMLEEMAPFAPQETILEQIVPYCHMLMTDQVPKVRARAIESLPGIIAHVADLPPSDTPLFLEYLFPQLLSAMSDMSREPVVLLAVAQRIGSLARHALRLAELAVEAAQDRIAGAGEAAAVAEQAGGSGRRSAGAADGSAAASTEIEPFDVQWKRIREAVKKVVKALLEYLPSGGVQGPERAGGDAEGGGAGPEDALLNLAMGREVKIALLRSMCELAETFGRDGTHNFLLPYLISFMNDFAWEVRAAFCEEAASLPKKVGQVSTEGIIWPCYEQALLDQEERVLQAALSGLVALVGERLLRRPSLANVASKVSPLLVHPSATIRGRAMDVLKALGEQLSAVDQYVFVMPTVRPFLQFELVGVAAIDGAIVTPLSRRTFERALLRRDEELHEALLHKRPLPQASPEERSQADSDALELMRPYLHLILRSRPTMAQMNSAGWPLSVAFKDDQLAAFQPRLVHNLHYPAMNPHCAPNRSLQATAESDEVGCEWPFASVQRMRHPLSLFSTHAFLTRALCLPPRPRDLGSLNYLDGTPYSIYATRLQRYDADDDLRVHADGVQDSVFSPSGSVLLTDKRYGCSPPLDLSESFEPFVETSDRSMGSSDRRISASSEMSRRGRSDDHLSYVAASDADERARAAASGTQRSSWRPQGFLLATLYEYAHQGGVHVVKVDVTDDSRTLVTGGKDGVVKVWNSAKLERDVAVASSHSFVVPMGTPGCKQQLRALRTVRNSKAVAIGSECGNVLLYRIDSRGSTDAPQVCRFAGGGDKSSASAVMCIEQFDTELESLVVFARQSGALSGWDLRRDTACWSMQSVPPWLGVPSCLALGHDGHSMVVGTLGGGLLVYDLRFLAPWKQWRVASGAAALSMRSAHFCPSPSVFVALDGDANEVALFDVVRGSCSTLFLTEPVVDRQRESAVSVPTLRQAEPTPGATPEPLFSRDSAARRASGSVRSLWLPPRGAQTFLLAGGADRKVRHWSLDPEHHAAEAYVVTPPDPLSPLDKAGGRTSYTSNHLGDVFVVQEQVTAPRGESPSRSGEPALWRSGSGVEECGRPQGPNPNHRDAILDMCTISLQSDILVTAGRDGLVKLWR